jgi:hypothetical protein
MRDRISPKKEYRGVNPRGGADKYRCENSEILGGEVANSLSVEFHGCEEMKEPFAFFEFP